MRLAVLLLFIVTFGTGPCSAVRYYVDVPDIPLKDMTKIKDWIRERTTSVRLPFCWRQSYGRGVGEVPGRVADCPRTYTNNGATCGRGSRDIYAPSKLANCPSGYRNMGLTCYRGPSTYGKKCTLPWKKYRCKSGYTDNGCTCGRGAKSLSSKHMVCPHGYFKGKAFQRCHKNCPSGYKNTGEYCHRPVSTKGMSSMRCKRGEYRIGARCYGGRSMTSCFKHQDSDAGLCYKKCKSGFHGVGPVCWQNCNAGWHNCGAACAASAGQCASNVINQSIAPLVVAANVLSFGLTKPAVEGSEQALKIGGKTVTSSTGPGSSLIELVKKLQSINPDTLKKGDTVIRRIFIARTGTTLKKVLTTSKVSYTTYMATERYAKAFADDFARQTSPEINAEIDRRFIPETALYIKQTWAKDQLSEMVAANGWDVAQTVLAAVSMADITGVTGVAEAYAKPKCQDHKPFPCSVYLKDFSGCKGLKSSLPGRFKFRLPWL